MTALSDEVVNTVWWHLKAIQHQVAKAGGPRITDTQVEQLKEGVLQFLQPQSNTQKGASN